MSDPRLSAAKFQVKNGMCVRIPAGTIITLCAYDELPAKEVVLETNWFVEVEDTVPEVREINNVK